MTTLYLLDQNSVYVGAQVLEDPYAALPKCTLTPPPNLSGMEVAVWDTNHWVVLPAYPEPPPPSPEQVQAEIVTATQERLDDFARTRSYDGVLSLCTYASSPNPKFKAEGQYGVEARDATWSKLYEILAEVQAGTRPMPSGYADIEPELPPLVWPDEAPGA